jgi:hypothetical protein
MRGLSLLDDTIRRLRMRGVTLERLHDETHLPIFWLRAIARGEIKNPGVNRIQILWEFLANRPLLRVPKENGAYFATMKEMVRE